LPRLTITGLRKAFGPTPALAGVDVRAEAGEVHALIGENGAGKSTLLKILAGVEEADGGSIRLDGDPYWPSGPVEARAAGVATVYQELSLCPHLSVEENVTLGVEPTRFGFIDRRERRRRAEAALRPILGDHWPFTLDTPVGDLPPASRQLVEIGRALGQERPRVLILDEPTSSLGAADVQRLFSVLRGLRERGLLVLYVSHFLEEVQSIAASYTVLRDGRSVGAGAMESVTLGEIVTLMAGRKIDALFPRSPRSPGEVVLSLHEIAGEFKPESATLDLRRGEVLGLAGLVGAGRTELVRTIFGLDRVVRGTVRVKAFTGPASPSQRLAQGVGLLSEDRKGEGLALPLSIAQNLTLSDLSRLGPLGLVFPGRERAAAGRFIETLGVRCQGPDQPVRDLSGGNQQKVALARLLYHEADVLLLDEPTRGVDVASKAQIYAIIDREAAAGKAILMISSYLPELLGVCDRIAVMRRGRLGPARPAAGLSEHDVLTEAAGA
jgi:ribose transport system ATP-binding protein